MKKTNKKINAKVINKRMKIAVIVLSILLSIAVGFIIFFLVRDDCDKNTDDPNSYRYTEKKPILYLYPKKNGTKITVTFDKPEFIKISYPVYKDKWVVTADKNGTLTDKKQNTYYGLYWEETKHTDVDFSKGYYVTKDNAAEFLDEKLKYIGLNERERNEFIIYWLPILVQNEKSVVHFELTEERQTTNALNIKPKPDSLLRVSMHVKKVDKEPKDLQKQGMKHFNRKGFAAVEWGGVIHSDEN